MTEIQLSEAEQEFRQNHFDNVALRLGELMAALDGLLAPITDADRVDVEKVRTAAELWHAIFDSNSARTSYVQVPASAKPTLWLNDIALNKVQDEVGYLTRYLQQLTNVSLADFHANNLTNELKAAIRRSKLNDFGYLASDTQDQVKALVSSVESRLELFHRSQSLKDLQSRATSAVAAAESSATVATSAADATRAAAGITGDAKMSSFYSELATKEGERADNFRKLTVAFAFGGLSVAAFFVLVPMALVSLQADLGSDYAHVVQKAIFTAAIFGLSGYFARQSHQHRSMANWAGSLAVQLQTFDAYVASIEDPAVKDDLRKSFGARVFGDHPAMKGDPTVTPSAAAMDTAVGWAAKFAGGSK